MDMGGAGIAGLASGAGMDVGGAGIAPSTTLRVNSLATGAGMDVGKQTNCPVPDGAI